jgi:hypothetical protein
MPRVAYGDASAKRLDSKAAGRHSALFVQRPRRHRLAGLFAATGMTRRLILGGIAVLLAAATSAGCVVLPVTVYVAESGEGTPVYERCSLTPELPVGVKVEQNRVQAIVSIVAQQGGLVRVQFDIPEGMTVVLRESAIRIDAKDGTPPFLAAIANVNPVAPARYPETPVIEKLVLPVDAPLRGGRLRFGTSSSNKHYWIAAPLAGAMPRDAWVMLPELSIDGTTTRFEEIHFRQHFALGRGLLNC